MKLFLSIFAVAWGCLLFAASKNDSVHLIRSNFPEKSFITISYKSPFQNDAKKDLKEFWKQSLFYSLLQGRLQQIFPSDGIECTCYQQGFFEQPNAYTISITCASYQVVDTLQEICGQLEQIKKNGFSEKELKDAKERAYLGLYKFEGQRLGQMAQLISNQGTNENANQNLNILVETSKDLIELVSLNEVTEFSKAQMLEAKREVDVVVPNNESLLTEIELTQILDEQKWVSEHQNTVTANTLVKDLKEDVHHALLEEETLDAIPPQFEEISDQVVTNEQKAPEVAALPAPSPEALESKVQEQQVDLVNYYAELSITQEEQRMLAKIIITLAENNTFKLLFERKKLEKLGKRINHVHPIKFLGTILADPRLTHCLREIRKSSFKWEGFMDGLVRRMQEELARDNLKKYLRGFSNTFNANYDKLIEYIDNRNFEGMVISLL